MGIIPTPIDPGNDCDRCFLAGETPTLLKLFITGVYRAELWHDGLPRTPNGYYDLVQDPLDNCRWISTIATNWNIALTWYEGVSKCGGFILFPHIRFFGQVNENCTKHFTNALNVWAGNFYYGGWFFISTPAQMQSLIEMVTPLTGPDPRMELYPMDDDRIVLKFCDKKSATNVKIKFDTTAL